MQRVRTYEYLAPFTDFPALANLSGLEIMQRVMAGAIPPPPITATLGFSLIEVARGSAVFEGKTAEWQYNPLGTVHGGYGATMLDSAMGCAVHSTLGAGDIYTTLEFKINFVRALTHETGLVRGIGLVINETRTTAIAEGRIEDASGKLYAFATATCVIRRAGPA